MDVVYAVYPLNIPKIQKSVNANYIHLRHIPFVPNIAAIYNFILFCASIKLVVNTIEQEWTSSAGKNVIYRSRAHKTDKLTAC